MSHLAAVSSRYDRRGPIDAIAGINFRFAAAARAVQHGDRVYGRQVSPGARRTTIASVADQFRLSMNDVCLRSASNARYCIKTSSFVIAVGRLWENSPCSVFTPRSIDDRRRSMCVVRLYCPGVNLCSCGGGRSPGTI